MWGIQDGMAHLNDGRFECSSYDTTRYIKRGRSRRLPVEESSPVEEKDLSLPWPK